LGVGLCADRPLERYMALPGAGEDVFQLRVDSESSTGRVRRGYSFANSWLKAETWGAGAPGDSRVQTTTVFGRSGRDRCMEASVEGSRNRWQHKRPRPATTNTPRLPLHSFATVCVRTRACAAFELPLDAWVPGVETSPRRGTHECALTATFTNAWRRLGLESRFSVKIHLIPASAVSDSAWNLRHNPCAPQKGHTSARISSRFTLILKKPDSSIQQPPWLSRHPKHQKLCRGVRSRSIVVLLLHEKSPCAVCHP